MPQAIQNFYLFPIYPSREVYDSQPGDNADAPKWDGNRKTQNWVDPNPANILDLGIGVGKLAIYDAAVEIGPNGSPLSGPDGQPKVSKMALPLAEATSPNFLPAKGIVPTESDLGGGDQAKRMVANAGQRQSIPLKLPAGARVRWSAGMGSIAVVYLDGEPLPEEQGAAAQAAGIAQIYTLLRRLAERMGVS